MVSALPPSTIDSQQNNYVTNMHEDSPSNVERRRSQMLCLYDIAEISTNENSINENSINEINNFDKIDTKKN